MKTKISVYLFAIFCFGLTLLSCQKEESEYIDQTSQQGTITSSSFLANLLLGASQNPGSADNIIDGNSCSQVKYPVTVIANGQKVVLRSEADLDAIHAIFDQFPSDEDTLEIIFPMTVTLQDFSEMLIDDSDDLEDLVDACQGETEIACVDFVYPITLFTYNTEQEKTGTVVIKNDEELYLLFFSLDEEDLISIDFPISVVLDDDTRVSANSNEELEGVLDRSDCDEDEELEDFVEDFTSGNWYITYYFNDFDKTDNFDGYEFTFATDNSAATSHGIETLSGKWDLLSGDSPNLNISFGTNPPFDKLANDWEIVEASAEIIHLRNVNKNDGSVDYLTFGRNPNTEGSNEELNVLIESLTTGSWTVGLFEEEGTITTSNYSAYEFSFHVNSSVTAVSPTDTINGFWQIEEEDDALEVVLNFNEASNKYVEDLNDDWEVLEQAQTFIRLGDNSGDDTNLLTFEKT